MKASLGSGIARRVVALFVACALLPVAAAIVLSYGSVRDTLVSQSDANLREAAANYATSLVERLEVAESIAQASAAAGAISHDEGLRAFFQGQREMPRPDAQAPTLWVAPSPAGPASVWLARKAAAGGRSVALEMNPRFLWTADDSLPVLTDVCVYAADGVLLHCTRTLPRSVLESFRARPAGEQAGVLAWNDAGVRYLSAHRELFLRGKFGAAPWTIVVSQPEAHALAAATGVTRVVIPVVILGLLVAALLGLVQVRRTMRPLRDLSQAAARIGARDFGTKVPEQRDDEFGALARSFNAMSGRLERQFNALSAHAEIDAVILSSVDLTAVAAIVLRRMAELAPADKHLLLLAEGTAGMQYRIHTGNPADGLHGRTIALSAAEAGRLLAAPEGSRLAGDGHSALAGLAGLRTRHAFALPIATGDALAGLLMLAYVEDRVPDAEDVTVLRDLGDRVAVALGTARRDQELDRQAHYDALTQLPNRLLGLQELSRAVAAAERQQRNLAVMFVDLDGFSEVNDSLGHAAGDKLLVQSASRLRASVRKSDVVARIGGDEFAVVLTEVREGADAALVAKNVIDALSGPYELGAGNAFVSASIGIVLYPADGATAEDLLQHADLAMYRAKQQGRGQYAFFEPSMNAEVRRRVELEAELRLALERREFELHYQPQLELRSGRLIGGEALIRWHHSVKGMVPPLQFIGLAEANGLIEPIGRWALETACAQFMTWREQGIPIEHVSVNVSPRQFRNPDFVRVVAAALEASGIPVSALRLEITESAVIDDHGPAQTNLAALVQLGTPLELDDFGTGYSSLAHLQRLPIAAIKLDRAFTNQMESRDSARAVVQAAIDMAHALGKTVVAEGVENAEQLALLQRMGCDMMQGYYIGRPVAAADFAQLLRNRALAAPVQQDRLKS